MKPSSRRDTVGHIRELIGSVYGDKVFEDGSFDKVGMKLSHTVDFVATNCSQVSHSHHFGIGFFNYRNAGKHIAVFGERLLDILEELHVDLVNNLQMAWE